MNARTIAAALALCLAAGPLRASAAEEAFRVVANRALAVDAMDRDTLSRIFLRRITVHGGVELKPVMPREDSPQARAFAERVHAKSPAALRSYWNQLIFSGRDVPPVQKGNDEAVLAYVREHAGAIGYVSTAADVSGVAVVQVR